MKTTGTVLLFALLTAVAAAAQQDTKISIARWPDDKAAAVSLTFDDGMDTQLDVAAPILARHNLRATFFVTTGKDPWHKRPREWRQLADLGNELGIHTVQHPCLLEQIQPHAQEYTPAMMEAEIRDSAASILALSGNRRGLTFAYPCGNMSFGQPADQARNSGIYLDLIARYAFGARIYGVGGAQDPDALSVLAVPDLGFTYNKNFTELLRMFEPVAASGQWGVFCFHGVGGEWLAISADTLDELAAHFERHPEIWVAPFGDALRYTMERHAVKISASTDPSGAVTVQMQWPLDARIYDLPLTLKLAQPADGLLASVTAGGKAIPCSFQTEGGQRSLLIDVPAQTSNIRVEWHR